MPTSAGSIRSFSPLTPIAWLGALVLDSTAYCGGLGLLSMSALRAVLVRRANQPAFFPSVIREADQLLSLGIPLVGVANIGMGSFLSMQAYFGATFVDGSGAVVGVGLIRNLAPLTVGLTMCGLLAAKFIPELQGDRIALEREPGWVPDRFAREPEKPLEPGRLAAVRLAAAVIVGPLLAIWGALVGTIVGVLVAKSMLGVTFSDFFAMFAGMIWRRDVVSLVLKGMLFAGIAGLFACHEGLMPSDDPRSLPGRVCRSIVMAGMAILVANAGFFLLLYHAGPAFGPTLLNPPAR